MDIDVSVLLSKRSCDEKLRIKVCFGETVSSEDSCSDALK